MKYVIFAIAVIVLWQIKRKIFAKIDEDEARAHKTPGTAHYIRNNYPMVVVFLQSFPGYQIIFERRDMIQIGTSNDDEYFKINQYSDELLITFVRHSNVYKEWKFSLDENQNHIYYKLKSTI